MEQFKTYVDTSENINQVVYVEFTMNCKVIYGFDFHQQTFQCFNFPLRGGVREIVWFGFGAGKNYIMGGRQVYGQQLYVNFYRKTIQNQLNELIFQICQLRDSLNYCGVYYEEIYFDFRLVKP